MADLERISRAQLSSALTETSLQSQRRLSEEELKCLAVLVGQMAQRYPAQDLEQSLEGYLADFEQLALKYSLRKVQGALAALRIKPGQQFFPRPDEVAQAIEEQRERKLTPSSADAQKYFSDVDRWRKEHAEYMAELEAKNAHAA